MACNKELRSWENIKMRKDKHIVYLVFSNFSLLYTHGHTQLLWILYYPQKRNCLFFQRVNDNQCLLQYTVS